ncbi:MAG: hypothetical protein GY810_05525 [Aureispira sp.]|nr:hypothetical protein [Aureispira sp.]
MHLNIIKTIGLLGLFFGLLACNQPSPKTTVALTTRVAIPNQLVQHNDPFLEKIEGILYYQNLPFSGQQEEQYPDGNTKELSTYWEGKKHGKSLGWHNNAQQLFERYYNHGLKEGQHKGWWANGQLKFDYQFLAGEHHGTAQAWYESGQLYKLFNYLHGKEEGRQQMWTEEGEYKANYVIKNGRRYGLIGSKPCYTIEEQEQSIILP